MDLTKLQQKAFYLLRKHHRSCTKSDIPDDSLLGLNKALEDLDVQENQQTSNDSPLVGTSERAGFLPHFNILNGVQKSNLGKRRKPNQQKSHSRYVCKVKRNPLRNPHSLHAVQKNALLQNSCIKGVMFFPYPSL